MVTMMRSPVPASRRSKGMRRGAVLFEGGMIDDP